MPFSLYAIARPLLFRLDAEQAHAIAIGLLKTGLVPSNAFAAPANLAVRFCGADLPHPLGLAAGFDKHAEVPGPCFDMGFSFIELGGVTPAPQPGNAKPRLFRAPSAKAVINRFGFNSVGTKLFAKRLKAWRDLPQPARRVTGVNLAKNKETADAADDYVKGVEAFAAMADFLVVNVSSPNTPGLRDMQERGALTELLQRVMQARAKSGFTPRLFVKIAPDISEAQAADIAEVALAASIDGLVVGNTTLSRPASVPAEIAREMGGLSGQPLFDLSTQVLGQMYRLTGGRLTLIGCGGIFSGADAYAKIRAGASLLQLYTALVYEGPGVVARIAHELSTLLQRDGFTHVADAVGADFRKN
ncbi:MAG: quinone-dependent dihydroorotate dehydrogenase [Alphaproteobacteria bacterium]|nr:quinone-dependent dihydroorotate dehydrogenase [Alphaproteobacteria bacterium]